VMVQKEKKNEGRVSCSFRDPSGFLFWRDGVLYRQVNDSYRENYDFLVESGLLQNLFKEHLLIPHREVDDGEGYGQAYKILKPEIVSFVSYPYEWSFSQLKDAALLTLEIQKKALALGMILKDASAYNVQFLKGKPIFIDTLSFEKYEEGKPWVAYRQFCQHFLAPLALMAFRDVRLNQLLRVHLDGIPLDLASSLLPIRAKVRLGFFSHLYLHSKSQKHYANKQVRVGEQKYKIKKFSLLGLIDSLESTIKKLKWNPGGTEWGDYYGNTNYQQESFKQKKKLVEEFLSQIKPSTVWDLGANTGEFSRIAADQGVPTISFDIDPAAVEKNYRLVKERGEENILPLLADLTNPSPALGWQGQERMSLIERGPADAVLALALIHHLAISNNLPFSKIAHFFSQICDKNLIIEFVPKTDSNAQRLLATREDIFPNYTVEYFEAAFEPYFLIRQRKRIENSERIVYLLERKEIL